MPKENIKQIRHVNTHKVKSTDKIFLDANVWIYWLDNFDDDASNTYSEFLKRILEKSASIIINQEVISEVINRYLHNEAKRLNLQDYKYFRKTDNYRQCFKVISAFFKELSPVLDYRTVEITKGEFEDFLEINIKERMKPILDYKDYIFDLFAQKNELILVTHDKDFGAMQHTKKVLSANKKIIDTKYF